MSENTVQLNLSYYFLHQERCLAASTLAAQFALALAGVRVYVFSVFIYLLFFFYASRGSFAQALLLKPSLFSRTAAEKIDFLAYTWYLTLFSFSCFLTKFISKNCGLILNVWLGCHCHS